MAGGDSPWTFSAESATGGGDTTVTLVEGTTFLVCPRSGDLSGQGPLGLFMLDTRVLSCWWLTIDGQTVEPLSVTPNGPFSATFAGRVVDPEVVDAPTTVIRRRHIGRGMREDLEVRNHGADAVRLTVALRVGSDFGSLFAVKAGRRVDGVGPAELRTGAVHLRPAHRSTVDETTITASTPPDQFDDSTLSWNIALEPGEHWTNCLLVGVTVGGRPLEPSYRCGQKVEDAIPVSRLRQWRSEVTDIESDDLTLATATRRAAEDLGALRIFDPDHPERVVVAAGAPWFMTLFGRDSLIASWMALPLDHALALGVLQELADAQGRRIDPVTEEQPGRILHEIRFDSASARLLGGSNTYYGTIDATPLFVMLVAELARWSGITSSITDLLPAVDRALAWIDQYGDRDDDGFVEYLRSDPSGLENQGWKDSWDGIRHGDGRVATGPIALCEVQGYVYAAFRGRADLARALGEGADVADTYDQRADDLKARFDQQFWLDDVGWYGVGLDGDKEVITSLTSNLGHLLWTGIVPDHRAARLAGHLAGPSLFSGWGIRTLGADSPGYNPLSYHCGSVWPHDTALAVAGLARYRCDTEAQRLTSGLLAASAWSNGRLPELFGGFARDDLPSPVPYPASCSPQAWAAASPLLLVRAMLGLEPDLLNNRLRLRPRLPAGIDRLELTDIPLGDHRIEISVHDREIRIDGVPDHVDIEVDGA